MNEQGIQKVISELTKDYEKNEESINELDKKAKLARMDIVDYYYPRKCVLFVGIYVLLDVVFNVIGLSDFYVIQFLVSMFATSPVDKNLKMLYVKKLGCKKLDIVEGETKALKKEAKIEMEKSRLLSKNAKIKIIIENLKKHSGSVQSNVVDVTSLLCKLSEQIRDVDEELNIASDRKTLSNYFQNKISKSFSITMFSVWPVTLIVMLVLHTHLDLFSVFASFVLTAITLRERQDNIEKVFRSLNHSLGENSLPSFQKQNALDYDLALSEKVNALAILETDFEVLKNNYNFRYESEEEKSIDKNNYKKVDTNSFFENKEFEVQHDNNKVYTYTKKRKK